MLQWWWGDLSGEVDVPKEGSLAREEGIPEQSWAVELCSPHQWSSWVEQTQSVCPDSPSLPAFLPQFPNLLLHSYRAPRSLLVRWGVQGFMAEAQSWQLQMEA